MEPKVRRVLLVIGAFFVTNALLAELIGVKLFSVEHTLGLNSLNWNILGYHLSFDLTAGVILWPFVFVLTDIANEYFGKKGVRLLSYLVVGMIGYSFLMILLAVYISPSTFWVLRDMPDGSKLNMDEAFNAIFGQSGWIIVGSITAFLLGQLVDVWVFHQLRKRTGHGKIWLRATGSTLVSQLIDSFVVLFIAFYIGGPHWPLMQVLAIALNNYIFKFMAAIAMTPMVYLFHNIIDKYLGTKLSNKLMESAAKQ
ncbi:MAG: queuosine precursor transporter [Bacteroidetes bacterium]|nr:queuosine precursor transporter [Bacteroidota bacterium]